MSSRYCQPFPTSPASTVCKQSAFLATWGRAPSHYVELFIALKAAIHNFVKQDKNIVTINGCLARQFQIQLKVCSNKMYLGLVTKLYTVLNPTSEDR